jgi:starvation-inducible outer membrane lipoprotein
MKYLLVISMSLMLAGCSTMTRLLPKLEKIDLPEELMKPPQELKTIEKPAAPPSTPQAELTRDVTP